MNEIQPRIRKTRNKNYDPITFDVFKGYIEETTPPQIEKIINTGLSMEQAIDFLLDKDGWIDPSKDRPELKSRMIKHFQSNH